MLLGSKRLFRAILLTVLLFVLSLSASAKELPVRLGYYEDGDYMYRNAQGEYEGYNFEYFQEVSKLSGLRCEVIETGSWQAALQCLIDGEIDVLPAVYRTKERAGQMLFTDQPMCNIYTTLNVRIGDTHYDYEDFDAFQGMRVGIIRGSEDGENFKRYCAEHSLTVEIVDYEKTDELLRALEDGTLNGVAITHLGRSGSFRSVAQFSPNPLYIAVSNHRPDLLAEINRAINSILLRNPGFQMELYNKYLDPGMNQKPVFTKDELEYIESAGSVLVSYDPACAPLTYRDAEGDFRGVVADIFNLISENSGLSFQYEDVFPSEALELLGQGELDVICAVDGDYLWNERNHVDATLYYLRSPSVLITSGEDQPIQTLALQEGYRLSERVAKNNRDKSILYFRSVKECFEAVLTGRAQAAYTNTQAANYLLGDLRYHKLNATALTQYTSDWCIGVSKSADPRLFSILDKQVQYIAGERLDDLLLKNSIVPRPVSVGEFVQQHIWLVMGLIASVLCGVILLLWANLRNVSRSNRRIETLLYRDSLTGLDNLNCFDIKSGRLLHETVQGSRAILYCDIDRFKLINDNFGFEAGDRVLRAYGRILQGALQKDECCARVSADNFVLLLKCGGWDPLEARLQQLCAKLNQWRKDDGAIPYEISLSFGVHRIGPAGGCDIHRMLDFANYARNSAKNQSGNTIVFYDEQMRQKALFEQELEGRLSLALERGEFEPYYQPKVDMRTGEIVGSEALVRWNHPDHGLLMPGCFIPFFEKKGIVVQVDLALYETVCRTIRGWLDQGCLVTPVSCNFSQLHFERPGFVERVSLIADRWEIPHHLLEVEITESAIASVPESAAPALSELKKRGFLIAIDDFGSGYSSLGQLQQLRADVLKLDRSFVCNGLQGLREQIVIKNLGHMVKELGMAVICEGVETNAQVEELLKLGFCFAQGFYFYRPMPREAFEQLIHS